MAETIDWPPPRRPRRRRGLPIIFGVLALLVLGGGTVLSYYVDALWFESLGVADVFWKSNSKNMALLERHSDEVRPASWGDWLFVSAIVTAVIAVALVPLFVMYWIVHALAANFPAVAR